MLLVLLLNIFNSQSEWGNLELPLDGCKVAARRTETLKENPFNDNKMPRRDVKEFLLRVAGICDTDNGPQTEIVSHNKIYCQVQTVELRLTGWLPAQSLLNGKQTNQIKTKADKNLSDISHLSRVLMEGKLRHYSH